MELVEKRNPWGLVFLIRKILELVDFSILSREIFTGEKQKVMHGGFVDAHGKKRPRLLKANEMC